MAAAMVASTTSALGASSIPAAAVPAQAAEPAPWSTVPDDIWDVDTRSGTSRHTGVYRTIVWDLLEHDGVMYVGGDFTEVVAPDGSRTARSFLVAFDLETGAWIPSFDAEVDGVVYSLAVGPDGSVVASGELTGGVALLDPGSGDRVAGFDADLRHLWGPPAVFSVAVADDAIYAGGRFIRAGGTPADNLVKLDAVTGAADPAFSMTMETVDYQARPQKRVYDLEVDPGRNRLYVGGLFASVNGDPSTDAFAILDATTGATAAANPDVEYDDGRPITFLYDIALDGDVVRYGGKENFTISVDADTLARAGDVIYTNNGDHQVIHPGADTIWVGCHCWRQAFVAAPPQNPFRPTDDAVDVHAVFGIDRASGELLPVVFDLAGSAGAWDIVEDGLGRLWVGGEFTRGGAEPRHGIVRFSRGSDEIPELTACTAARDGREVEITWDGVVGDARVVVRRSVNASPLYWRGAIDEADSFTDTDRNASLAYTVELKVGSQVVAGPVGCNNEVVLAGPTGLEARRVTRERAVLRWDPAGAVEILRDGDVVGTDDDGWFTDLGLSPATTYTYELRSVDTGVVSDPLDVTTN